MLCERETCDQQFSQIHYCSYPNSCTRGRSHIASPTLSLAAINSASAVLRLIQSCLKRFHLIHASASNDTYPVVDFHFSFAFTKLASGYSSTLIVVLFPLLVRHTSTFLSSNLVLLSSLPAGLIIAR